MVSKGSWLALTLINLGANVYGISLKNKSRMNFYSQNMLGKLIREKNLNINNYNELKNIIKISTRYNIPFSSTILGKKIL